MAQLLERSQVKHRMRMTDPQRSFRIGTHSTGIRALSCPQWKGLQVLNGFTAGSILADELQNKTQLLKHSWHGSTTLSSAQGAACSGKAALSRKAISGQTRVRHSEAAVPEQQPGEAGVLATLDHSHNPSSRAALLLPSPWLLLRTHRNTFAGVLCPYEVADVCGLPRTPYLGAAAVSSMPHQPCHSCLEKWDPQSIYNISELLLTPEGPSLGGAEHSGTARHRTGKGEHSVLTGSQWSLASSKDLTHTRQCHLNLSLYFVNASE